MFSLLTSVHTYVQAIYYVICMLPRVYYVYSLGELLKPDGSGMESPDRGRDVCTTFLPWATPAADWANPLICHPILTVIRGNINNRPDTRDHIHNRPCTQGQHNQRRFWMTRSTDIRLDGCYLSEQCYIHIGVSTVTGET